MPDERELQRRLRSVESLSGAIGAMKSLSAHHLRQARSALEPARVYRAGIDDLVEKTGASLAAGVGGAGLLVVGGELGLCGAYNRDVAEAAAKRRGELGEGPTLCVGRRAEALLTRHGVATQDRYAGPTSVVGVTALLLEVARDILTLYVSEGLSSFEVVACRFAGVGASRPLATRLLPITFDREEGGVDGRYTSVETLAAVAVRELLYVTLHALLLDALASEHGSRLTATQAAEDWLDRKRDGLRRHLRSSAREASTQEVIEIAGGARALGRRGRRKPRC